MLRAPIVLVLVPVLMCACSRREQVSAADPAPVPPPKDWARRVARTPVASVKPTDGWRARKAVMDDSAEGTLHSIPARRLVYRVGFSVPPAFRERRAEMAPPAAELEIDLSSDRLRARFVGSGWPLGRGVEVRLRADLPGVYVFDGEGGRSLGSGEMASWFEGKPFGESHSTPRVRRESGAPSHAGSEPLCALIAEWTAQDRDDVVGRCAGGSIPPAFAFGPWRAELTAMVPMVLPGSALRGDEGDPPPPIAPVSSGTTLAVADLARIVPARGARDVGDEIGALEVDNGAGDTRVIVLVDGVPIGWVNAGGRARFEGLRVGTHRIGALRPLGVVRAGARALRIPGRLAIGRSRVQGVVRPPDAGAPFANAP